MESTALCPDFSLSLLAALFRSSFYDSNPLSSALSNQILTNPHNQSREYRRLNYESAVLSLAFPLVNVKNCVQELY